jgi:WhiB family transcriptional regulator, redox-sensing transcriptional regulator
LRPVPSPRPGIIGLTGALGAGMSRETESTSTAVGADSTDFFADAACNGADTSVFFPVSDTFAGEAKAICATCPVAEACLEYAIATRQSDGVWGGLTGIERHRLVRRRQKLAREEARQTSAA